MKIKAVAFDMDGTLFSSNNIISVSYQQTDKELNETHNLGLPIPDLSFVTKQIGRPRPEIFKELFPNMDDSLYTLFVQTNAENFNRMLHEDKGYPIDGAADLLARLKESGYMVFIASNGGLRYIETVVSKYNFSVDKPIFTLNNDNIVVKADILKEYLDYYTLQPQEIVMVGDRIYDVEAAQHNNIRVIGIKDEDNVYGESHELDSADAVVSSLNEVFAIIETWNNA